MYTIIELTFLLQMYMLMYNVLVCVNTINILIYLIGWLFDQFNYHSLFIHVHVNGQGSQRQLMMLIEGGHN